MIEILLFSFFIMLIVLQKWSRTNRQLLVWPITARCCFSILPENIRKPLGFLMFSRGMEKWYRVIWVNLRSFNNHYFQIGSQKKNKKVVVMVLKWKRKRSKFLYEPWYGWENVFSNSLELTYSTCPCSKWTVKTPELFVKSLQNSQLRHQDRFHILFRCFHCWL